jgi:Nitroreductase family
MTSLEDMLSVLCDPTAETDRRDRLAAAAAPSGGNTQRWRFLVVKDPEIKKEVQDYYNRQYGETAGPRYMSSAPPPGSDPPATSASTLRSNT